MKYKLAGNRSGWRIEPTDEATHSSDGYTEVRRNGTVVAVYRTSLLG